MTQHGSWASYSGGGAVILAVVLLLITGALLVGALRLPHPLTFKRPGRTLGALLVVLWLLSALTFLVAITAYGLALSQQVTNYSAPPDPIFPVTLISGAATFVAIFALAGNRGRFWVVVGSAVVGAIAGPMIFELPFDIIVMWRTYPPTPPVLYTLLFFFPLFLVELLSFALVFLSPFLSISRYTFLALASMFFVFALWALVVGFAYPLSPLPTAFNMVSKVLAFATAVSLFLPAGKQHQSAPDHHPQTALSQTPSSSGLL